MRAIGITVLFTVMVCEGGLRLVGYEFPNFWQYDPIRGWSLIPNARGWWRSEGNAYVVINSQGLRDREHDLAKPPNTLRIAVLGDSYAEALQVPLEQTYWARIEQRLAQCDRLAGKQVEVINFGVSSYGTANEYLTLQDVWRYAPDIVILAFLTGNDFYDNSPALDRLSGPRPYYRLERDKLVLDQSRNQPLPFYKRAWHAARSWSRTAQLIERLRDVRKQRVAARGPSTADAAIYRKPDTLSWNDTWAVSEALIAATRDEVVSHHADFWFVTLSNSIQVDPDSVKRKNFMTSGEVTDLFYPDEELARFAQGAGIATITLAPELYRIARERNICLHGFANTQPCTGHWNPEGHLAAGRIVASRICEGR